MLQILAFTVIFALAAATISGVLYAKNQLLAEKEEEVDEHAEGL